VAYILVGNISFLGFLAGNMAYAIFKKSYNYTFPAACLIGIIIMGFTFLINKNVLNSNVSTSGLIPIMGIPYFIFLMFKEK
ncbi:MAG: iron chelate uptake ABC transporter family permease subunit, partial [Mycoplasmoidaceae bacterium]